MNECEGLNTHTQNKTEHRDARVKDQGRRQREYHVRNDEGDDRSVRFKPIAESHGGGGSREKRNRLWSIDGASGQALALLTATRSRVKQGDAASSPVGAFTQIQGGAMTIAEELQRRTKRSVGSREDEEKKKQSLLPRVGRESEL